MTKNRINKRYMFTLDEKTNEMIDREAKKMSLSRSAYIRTLIARQIEQQETIKMLTKLVEKIGDEDEA